ncbi:hypothetical protein ACRTDJ_18135 [Shewanella algae]
MPYQIYNWSDISGAFSDSILLGNGASISIDRDFTYNSLKQHAIDHRKTGQPNLFDVSEEGRKTGQPNLFDVSEEGRKTGQPNLFDVSEERKIQDSHIFLLFRSALTRL